MPAQDFALALIAGEQSDFGIANINTQVRDQVSPVDETDGAVLGNRESGTNNTGIDFTLGGVRTRPADAANFTKQFASFNRGDPTTFSVAWQLKGSGETTGVSPAPAEFNLHQGIQALLKSGGLTPQDWGGGTGREYKGGAVVPATAKLFFRGYAIVLYDLVSSLSFAFTPSQVAIATATLQGVFHSVTADAFPASLSYGTQASVGAKIVEQAAFNWGIGGALRGFVSNTITVDNNISDFEDSNAIGGIVSLQQERTISTALTVRADSGDPDFEWQEVIRTSAPTADMIFKVGDANPGSAPALSYRVEFNNPEVQDVSPGAAGTQDARVVNAIATGTGNGDEFSLIFY